VVYMYHLGVVHNGNQEFLIVPQMSTLI
jgi:hypothetical protein